MMGLGNDLQFKTAVAISSYLDQRIAEVVFESLWALTVARIAGGIHHGIILGMPQVFGYSGLQDPVRPRLWSIASAGRFRRPGSRVFDSRPISCQ
jgi:hypothetical protein